MSDDQTKESPVNDTHEEIPEPVEPAADTASSEPPVDPDVAGQIEPAELAALNEMRKQGNNIIMQLGTTEVTKARLLGNLQGVEDRAQKVLDGIAARLGIPNNQPWQVGPDGQARLVRNVIPGPGTGEGMS